MVKNMNEELKELLKDRGRVMELLEAYSEFLEEHGYIDSDWWQEEPFAIDEFLKQY